MSESEIHARIPKSIYERVKRLGIPDHIVNKVMRRFPAADDAAIDAYLSEFHSEFGNILDPDNTRAEQREEYIEITIPAERPQTEKESPSRGGTINHGTY